MPAEFVGRWRKLHMRPPIELQADWDLLTWQARGLYSLLLIACDDLGLLHCGRAELKAVCAFVRAPISDFDQHINPLLAELIAAGWLVYTSTEKILALPHFAASQAAVTDEALRKRAYRANQAVATHGGLSQDSPARSQDRARTKTPERREEKLEPQKKEEEKEFDKSELYRLLAILRGSCRDVLHLDLVDAYPQQHPEIEGDLRAPFEGYWLSCLKTYRPSDEALQVASAFLGKRQHWQDRSSGQGVDFAFLVKPPGTNFKALLSNSAAWQASTNGQSRTKGGHVRASAAAQGEAPSDSELRTFLDRGAGNE